MPSPPLPPTLRDRYALDVPCAGRCGKKETIAEPPPSRPLLRAAAGLYYAIELAAKGWEFWEGKWWCRGCRVRKRLVKALP